MNAKELCHHELSVPCRCHRPCRCHPAASLLRVNSSPNHTSSLIKSSNFTQKYIYSPSIGFSQLATLTCIFRMAAILVILFMCSPAHMVMLRAFIYMAQLCTNIGATNTERIMKVCPILSKL